ncbi:hypothetical protein ACIBEJ_00455 [Nonomuraea sp. NPDC050790]|uniref:hypothetical protein n=1 Tax=Nonomuraea sp. NPDC050790 TaxID=3364371 RepID=UPI0037AF77C6
MEKIIYYRHDDGSVSSRAILGDDAPAPLPDAVEITESEYQAAAANIDDAVAEHRDALLAVERQQVLADLDALLTAGIPRATAERLAGYDPELHGQEA